jgi:hypothetical protein
LHHHVVTITEATSCEGAQVQLILQTVGPLNVAETAFTQTSLISWLPESTAMNLEDSNSTRWTSDAALDVQRRTGHEEGVSAHCVASLAKRLQIPHLSNRCTYYQLTRLLSAFIK